MAQSLFIVLLLILGVFNVNWKYYINSNKISIGLRAQYYHQFYIDKCTQVFHASHSILILSALIYSWATIHSVVWITCLSMHRWYTVIYMTAYMVLLRMQGNLKPHYFKTWLITKQLLHRLKLVIHFAFVFAVTIMI